MVGTVMPSDSGREENPDMRAGWQAGGPWGAEVSGCDPTPSCPVLASPAPPETTYCRGLSGPPIQTAGSDCTAHFISCPRQG